METRRLPDQVFIQCSNQLTKSKLRKSILVRLNQLSRLRPFSHRRKHLQRCEPISTLVLALDFRMIALAEVQVTAGIAGITVKQEIMTSLLVRLPVRSKVTRVCAALTDSSSI